MNPVETVKISQLIPIYKMGIEAERIEVARVSDLQGNELQFNIIVGKGLYKINDLVIYIMPDYCLPDSELFSEYWRPGGDSKACRLGRNGRIRALKFNFQFKNDLNNIYSNGIILPVSEVAKYYGVPIITDIQKNADAVSDNTDSNTDLQTLLGITKYVAEDSFENQKSGLTKGKLPAFLYATDEPRCELLKNYINKCYEEGEILSFTRKRDGSSITNYCRKYPINPEEYEIGICTRNQEKKLEQQCTSAYKDIQTGVMLHPYSLKTADINENGKNIYIQGWYNSAIEKFYTDEEIKNTELFEPIISEIRDTWVDTTKKYNILDKLSKYCIKYDVELALRGELIGAGNKGSGNKLNSDAKNSESHIAFFGVDDLSSGHATRIHYGQEHNLKKVCEELDLEYTEELIEVGPCTYDGIILWGDEYFKRMKEEQGIIVEGIVIRSKYSNALSCKYINSEYDSRS